MSSPPNEVHVQEDINQQLEFYEKYLLNILKIQAIENKAVANGSRPVLSSVFKKNVLNIKPLAKEVSSSLHATYVFEKNLKESIQAFSNLIAVILNNPEKIGSASLEMHVNSVVTIFQKLLSSVEIFDTQIQESLQPLVDFLYKFNQCVNLVDSPEILFVLKGFEFVKRFAEKHEETFDREWLTREEAIIHQANADSSIELLVNILLQGYVIETQEDNSNINDIYVRAKLILELGRLKNLRREGGDPVLTSEFSGDKIDECIVILLDGDARAKIEGYNHLTRKSRWSYYTHRANEQNKLYAEVEEYVEERIRSNNEAFKKKVEVKEDKDKFVQARASESDGLLQPLRNDGPQVEDRKVEIGSEKHFENARANFEVVKVKNEGFVESTDASEANRLPRQAPRNDSSQGICERDGKNDKTAQDKKEGEKQKEIKKEKAESEKQPECCASLIFQTMFGFCVAAKQKAEKYPSATVAIGIVSLLVIGGITVATGGLGLPVAAGIVGSGIAALLSYGFFRKKDKDFDKKGHDIFERLPSP